MFKVGDKIEVIKQFTQDEVTFYPSNKGTVVDIKFHGGLLIEWDFGNRLFHSGGKISKITNAQWYANTRRCYYIEDYNFKALKKEV